MVMIAPDSPASNGAADFHSQLSSETFRRPHKIGSNRSFKYGRKNTRKTVKALKRRRETDETANSLRIHVSHECLIVDGAIKSRSLVDQLEIWMESEKTIKCKTLFGSEYRILQCLFLCRTGSIRKFEESLSCFAKIKLKKKMLFIFWRKIQNLILKILNWYIFVQICEKYNTRFKISSKFYS